MDTSLAERDASQPPAPVPEPTEAHRLPVTAHLEELRKRLWVCLGAITLAATVSFVWADRLIDILKRPAGAQLPRLAFFGPPEAVMAYMKAAVSVGLMLTMPVLLYEIWAFVRPGLTPRERRYGLQFVWAGSVLFLAGGLFAYWVVLPVSLRFLLGFGGGQLQPVISISQYLSFTTTVILACGVIFEMPIVVLMLAKLSIVSPQALRRQWRHALVAIVVAAALLTPTTDVATMLLMTVPMLALYEISVWIAALATRRPHRRDA